mmetsp:Transcript_128948/g.234272  ORF Transcript_128948/g.234272 Transcript_128948/m.234272 type:complete len:314 (+) Transcript_128948:75-1016(+)
MAGFVSGVASTLGILPIDKVTLRAGRRGPYHELADAVPGLMPFYSKWELNYDTVALHEVSKVAWIIPATSVTLYAVGILAGTKFMESRKAFELKRPLAFWNLFLSVFSLIGSARTMPHLFYNLYAFGFEDTICRPAVSMYGCGSTGLWVQLFIFSKIPELFDTLFIVLRKKKLSFLHWYHHITVLLFCWHSYTSESTTGLYFAVMNYTVHGIMYGYYFLAAVNRLPTWFPPIVVTLGQIAQMIIGVALTVISITYYPASATSSRNCDVKIDNLIVGGLMYASYFALFVHFAVERYILAPKRKRKAKAGEKKSE